MGHGAPNQVPSTARDEALTGLIERAKYGFNLAEIRPSVGQFKAILRHILLALEQPDNSKPSDGQAQPRASEKAVWLLESRDHHPLHAVRKQRIKRPFDDHYQSQGESEFVHDFVTNRPFRSAGRGALKSTDTPDYRVPD